MNWCLCKVIMISLDEHASIFKFRNMIYFFMPVHEKWYNGTCMTFVGLWMYTFSHVVQMLDQGWSDLVRWSILGGRCVAAWKSSSEKPWSVTLLLKSNQPWVSDNAWKLVTLPSFRTVGIYSDTLYRVQSSFHVSCASAVLCSSKLHLLQILIHCLSLRRCNWL